MYPRFSSPKTLITAEQRLLRAVRVHGSPRDRALLSLALGTGLRLRVNGHPIFPTRGH